MTNLNCAIAVLSMLALLGICHAASADTQTGPAPSVDQTRANDQTDEEVHVTSDDIDEALESSSSSDSVKQKWQLKESENVLGVYVDGEYYPAGSSRRPKHVETGTCQKKNCTPLGCTYDCRP